MPPINTTGFWSAGPTLAFSLFPHSFPGSHVTKRSRPLLLQGFYPAMVITHQKLPPFPNPAFPGASFASCAVSMGLGQCDLTEVLIDPRWLPTATVLVVFFIAILNSLKSVPTWYSHGSFDYSSWIQFGSSLMTLCG